MGYMVKWDSSPAVVPKVSIVKYSGSGAWATRPPKEMPRKNSSVST